MDYEKRYKEALERVRDLMTKQNPPAFNKDLISLIFPELKESEDEQSKKWILEYLHDGLRKSDEQFKGQFKTAIAWLEKQKHEETKEPEEVVFRPTAGCNIDSAARQVIEKQKVSEKDIVLAFNGAYIPVCNKTKDEIVAEYHDWIKKQGEQKQLYIRFGEIPTDEKSKIYQGEIEVGTEKGVSVYPAFKTSEGDIVLGLSLPITKTTLYTQQHLIEYDDRPCYLVNGDYVGKDTDGQPLIKNVSIIEKIDTYRVKEKKQCEQKFFDYENANIQQKDFASKVEPKFKVGDWIANGGANPCYVKSIFGDYYELCSCEGFEYTKHIIDVNYIYHLWTIKDAKDGDVLTGNRDAVILIFRGIGNEEWNDVIDYYCRYDYYLREFIVQEDLEFWGYVKDNQLKPGTKEQRDLLFQEMKQSGYEWDAEKKELVKQPLKITPKFCVGQLITNNNGIWYKILNIKCLDDWYYKLYDVCEDNTHLELCSIIDEKFR